MKHNTEQDKGSNQEAARLILVAFSSVCIGFLLAMLFGALPLPAMTTSHEWVGLLVSTLAAVISAYAVYLVGETLRETRVMVASQLKSAEDEFRPILYFKDMNISCADKKTIIEFSLSNYGRTPAMDISAVLTFYESTVTGSKNIRNSIGFTHAVPPSGEVRSLGLKSTKEIQIGESCKMKLEIVYGGLSDKVYDLGPINFLVRRVNANDFNCSRSISAEMKRRIYDKA